MTHEAQAYKRIFAMLFMLRDDFAWIIKNNKVEKKAIENKIKELADKKNDFALASIYRPYAQSVAYHKAVSDNFNAVNAMINRLLMVSKGETPKIISKEMTSERIKDLHVGLDTLLDIENIEEVMAVIKSQMIQCEE